MRTINIHEAKTHLSRLVEEVSEGEEVVIARAGKPVARLVPVKKASRRRKLGVLAGRFTVPADFDAPLSEEVTAMFEGRRPCACSLIRTCSSGPPPNPIESRLIP